MKIIRLSTFLDFGGVETRLANISFVKDENEWVFICMNREGKAAEIIKKNGKRIINLKVKPSIYNLNTLKKICQIIKCEKPDVVHTSGAEANFHGIIAAKLAKVPIIIGEEIGIPNHSLKARIIFTKIYKSAKYIIGNSDAVLEKVHQLEKVAYKNLKKINNPIIFKDLSKYNSNSNSNSNSNQSDVFHIITISRLEPIKNIEGVINVVSKLIKQDNYNIKLSICGTGTVENKLKEKTKELGIEGNVDFIGFISDPYKYLMNSDMYILNSFSEGFSNSLVEAMYSKTLSISTSVGAAPEMIKDGKNGFLIPANDEHSLYLRINEIMMMPSDSRKKISEEGHKTVIKNYSLESHIKELMKIYKSS